MLAPHLKSKIDDLWNKFWTAGITNPLVAIEQITYLLFLKRLEGLDAQRIKNGKKSIYDTSIYTEELKGKISFHQGPKGQNSKSEYEKLKKESDKEFQSKVNQCKWSYIQKQSNDVSHLINTVFPWLRNLEEIIRSADTQDNKLGSIGNRMSDAYFQLDPNKGKILAEAIQLIDELFSNIDAASINDDIMGDTFEYLLSEVSSAGKNGQFRTPRHFIRMMVEILDPEPGMKCIDPASGTGGFIFSIISFLLQKYTDKDGIKIEWDGTPHRAIGDKLNSEEDKKLFDGRNYTGFDNDRTMVRIGWMNLLLHGIENPGIYQRDSLAKRKEADDLVQKHILSLLDSETYDRVAANPPFTGTVDTDDLDDQRQIFPRAGESGGKAKVAITNKSELLFVWLMLDLLVVGGKCAVIVPEGVLFGSTDAHIALRRELLMEHQVEAIISLPGGAFQPYTGVKTSILIFQKETKKSDKASAKDLRNKIPRTESVWFYEIEEECYSLDAKRTERKGQNNDLWDAVKKFKIRNEKNYDDLDYYQPTYSTERWRLADDALLKKYPDDKEVRLSQGKLANLSELFKLPGNGDPTLAESEIDKKQFPIIKDLIESILYNQPLNSEKSPDIEVLKKEITKKFKEAFFFGKYFINKEEVSYKSLFDKDDSKGRTLYEKKVNEIFEVVRLANLSFDKLRMTGNDYDDNDVIVSPSNYHHDSVDKDVIVSLSNYQNNSEEIFKNLKGKKAKYKIEDYTGIAFKIAKEYAKLDGFDVTLRTQESFKQKEKLKTPKSWSSPIRKYLENPDWTNGKLKGSHDSKGNVRTEYVKSIRLYNDAGKLVDELNEKERIEFLEKIPDEQKAFYNTTLLDPDCVEAKGWNLSAGQYKPFVFSEAEDSIPVSDRIKELQTDVADVQTRLVKLLEMVK